MLDRAVNNRNFDNWIDEWSAARPAVAKPRLRDGTMRFGIFWPYAQTALPTTLLIERNPDVMDVTNHIRLARAVEQAGFDAILLPDGYAAQSHEASEIKFLDPSTSGVIWAVPLIMATKRIGIFSTLHTTYLHPLHIARFGAHLSHLSGGRWGWNIVAGHRITEASLFGYEELPDHENRYARAEEMVRIVRKLWESPLGVDHQSDLFKVRGRMRGPFPVGSPALVSAASSGRGHDFAIAHCDYLFGQVSQESGISEIISDMTARAEAANKPPPPLLITAVVLIRDEPGLARQHIEELYASFDPVVFDQLIGSRGRITQGGKVTDFPILAGTTDEVAEQIIDLHRRTGVSGLVLRMPYWAPEEALRLAPVFAKLQKAGVWSPPEARDYCW